MQTKVINPYGRAGGIVKNALDFIIANMPPDPTFEQLTEVYTGSVFTPDPESPSMNDAAQLFLGGVLPFAYNGYVNGGLGKYVKYTENQIFIINKLLDCMKSISVESIGDFISGIDETIAASELPCEEQGPLFLATACAKGGFEYWMAQVDNPATLWAPYFSTDKAINYLHVAGWVSAGAQGVLLTYGIVKPPQIQILDIFSAVVGSIGLSAGKVVFGWVGSIANCGVRNAD